MWKRYILTIAAVVGLGASAAKAQSLGTDSGTDTQLWTDTTYNIPLNKEKDLTFTLLNITRAGEDISRYNDERVGFSLSKRTSPNFTIGAGYQRRQINFSRDARVLEDILLLSAVFNAPIGDKFDLVNTNLLEYRESSRDFFLYRNLLQLNYPTTLFKTPVTPYLLTDVFYDTQNSDIPRYRYAVGLTRRFSPNFSASVYGMRQIESGFPRLGDANIIGLSLRFSQ